jgi:hypothetical protein
MIVGLSSALFVEAVSMIVFQSWSVSSDLEYVQRFHSATGGYISLFVIDVETGSSLLNRAKGGDEDAGDLMSGVFSTVKSLISTPSFCGACRKPIPRISDKTTVCLMRATLGGQHALGFGLCDNCSKPRGVMDRALVAVRAIWPDLRTIEIAAQGTA